jgi:hypothetical protein
MRAGGARGSMHHARNADAYSERPFFFLSPKLSYVLFILARDHLGKLVLPAMEK